MEPFIGGTPVLNYYCEAYEEFFSYAAERLHRIAGMLARR